MHAQIEIRSRSNSDFLDITREIAHFVKDSGIKDGLCHIYIPHTTCGITINENADPDVRLDMQKELNRIVPWTRDYHHAEGNSAAHIKASMMGFSTSVPILNGALALGIWQGIYLCEFDGPRTRKVIIQII